MTNITLQECVDKLDVQFPERRHVIEAGALALATKQHVVFIGPPGTAKSLLVRTLTACTGKKYFETLLGAFTPPEEIFGGLSVKGFENDKYIRNTAHFMPEAEVANLEEIFRSNPSCLNAMLGILNERRFTNDGQVMNCPLISCFASTNDMPENEALDALWDRFMIRQMVPYLVEKDNFLTMLKGDATTLPGHVDLDQVHKDVDNVKLTPETIDAVWELRVKLSQDGFTVSDRRWKNSLTLFKGNAFLHGNSATSPEDLEVLENVLWNKPDEVTKISRIVQTFVSPDGAKATRELDAAKEIYKKLPEEIGSMSAAAFQGAWSEGVKDIKVIIGRIEALPKNRKTDFAMAEIRKLQVIVGKKCSAAFGL